MGLVTKLRLGMLPESAYKENCEAINEENYITLKKTTYWGAIIFAAIAAASVIVKAINNYFFLYLQCSIMMFTGYLITRLIVSKRKRASKALLYLAVTIILTGALVLGTFLEPEGISAGFIAAIAVFPSTILDRPSRIATMMTLITVIFIFCSFEMKNISDSVMDCINGVVFYFVGLFLMRYSVNAKMQNIMIRVQLEWRESRYRTILSASDDIVFEYDPDLNSYYLSDNVVRYFDEKLSFEKLCQIKRVHPEDHEKYKRLTGVLDSLEKSAHEEIRFFTKNGEPVWFEVLVTALINSDGSKRRLVGRLINIDGRKRREEILKIKSQTDSATGLYNKAVTEAKISEVLAEKENGLALLLVDIDNLKELNDTLGHVEGDRAILEFAEILKNHFRDSDIVGRIGGDEFMVLLKGVKTRENLERIISGLTHKLSNIRAGEDKTYPLSGSLGAAMQTEKREGFEQLYRMADSAMYCVKKNGGKNGYEIYR